MRSLQKINNSFFFDLDGPILDISDKYYQAYKGALEKFGAKALAKNEYWRLKRLKVPDYDILKMTSSECFLDEYRAKRNVLIEQKNLLKLDFVWRELQKTYQKLFNQLSTNLITLRLHPNRTFWQLKNLGIYSWFNSIICHPISTTAKDRWQIKVELINKSGLLKNVNAKNCVFVGDTETDILAGQNLGMKTIAVSFGIRDKKLLSPLKPDLLFDTPKKFSSYLEKSYL